MEGRGMQILLDFINADRTLQGVKDFLAKAVAVINESSPTERMDVPKYYFRFGDDEDTAKRKFFLMSRDRYEADMKNRGIPQDEWCGYRFVYADDPEFDVLLQEDMAEVQYDFLKFLDSCLVGFPDLNFLNAYYVSPRLPNYDFVPSEDPFRPRVRVRTPHPSDVIGIVSYDVISDFLDGRGPEYKRITVCSYCHRFTVGGSTRREYCSVKCKNAAMYRKRKDKSLIPWSEEERLAWKTP